MKKLLRVVNVIAVLGLVLVLSVACNNTQSSSGTAANTNGNSVAQLGSTFPIAYIDTDSLLRAYEYAVFLQEELLKKEEKSRTDFNEEAKKLQSQMNEFQRKVQNNGFLSRERAEQEQMKLMQREQELQGLNNKLSNELMVEQNSLNSELRDSITSYLAELNSDGRYKLILSNTLQDNVLYSVDEVNITQAVINALNGRYAASKK